MRKKLFAGATAASLVVLVVLLLPSLGRWYVQQRIIPLVSQRLKRRVTVDHITFGLWRLRLEGITVTSPLDPPGSPLVTVPRVTISYRLAPLLLGRLDARQVFVEQPRVNLLRLADGRSNFLDLLSRRRKGRASGRIRVREVQLQRGVVQLEDRQRRLTLVARGCQGTVVPGQRSQLRMSPLVLSSPLVPSTISFARVEVAWRMKGGQLHELPQITLQGGRVKLLPRLELTDIKGRLGPARQTAPTAARDTAADQTKKGVTHPSAVADAAAAATAHVPVKPSLELIDLQLEGSYGGAKTTLWSARGWIDPQAMQVDLQISAARFSLHRIASVLKMTPIIKPAQTMIDGDLHLSLQEGVLRWQGGLEVTQLNLFHPALARTPMLGLSGRVKIDGSLQVAQEKLEIKELQLSVLDLSGSLHGTIARLTGQPLLDLSFHVPPVPCQTVLDRLPRALVPQLQGFQLGGTFGVDVHARVDYQHLDELELTGQVGLRHCKVLKAPSAVDAEHFLDAFEHEVETSPGQVLRFIVGPENPDFVPYADISPHVIHVFLTTEDAGFFRHRGFIPSQFKSALARNLKQGGFRLGASTISMQTVKNVILTHEKTLSRKLQELVLTWYLEQRLSKERILEIYLNAIEFGPGIYGIGAAARHYFGQTAKEITPLQASFLATILPSPKRRYVQYCRGELTESWDRYVRRVLRRMVSKGYVSEEEQAEADQQKIVFARDLQALTEEDCRKELLELLEAWTAEGHRRIKEAVLQAAPHQLDLYLEPLVPRAKQ